MNERPTALITGSAVRLGKAIALALARAGYDIAVHYNSSQGAAEATCAELRELGVECQAFQLNLSDVAAIRPFVATVKATMPTLSLLVNSASAYESATIAASSAELFDQQFAINLRAPFFLTQAFAAEVGQGNVINILDNKVGFNQYEYAAYLLSKKAFVEFTKMAAMEFAPQIRVNGVAPGVVLPATTRSEEYIAWRVQAIPLQKQGNPDHITHAILTFLDNPFVTGQILTVDGGENLAHVGRNAAQFDPNKI